MNKKVLISIIVAVIIILAIGIVFILTNKSKSSPEDTLNKYISYINDKNYDGMYQLLNSASKEAISSGDFIARNENIYDGIELQNIEIEITSLEKLSSSETNISYNTKMNTLAGEINFSNIVTLVKEEEEYKITWSSNVIYPQLNNDDKLRIKTSSSKRGTITDRNNRLLAGEGEVSSVGLVPRENE